MSDLRSAASVLPFGDQGLVVEFAHELSPEINGRARALARSLAGAPGVVETVPTLRAVLVVVDPRAADRDQLAEVADRLARDLTPDLGGRGRVLELPVVYGGESGPDLEEVARAHAMSPQDVIEVHAGQEYLVFMLGFAPGFPYMGTLPPPLHTPRLRSPRTRVPAGSVGIADVLTGIYPLATPGGWRIIGRTPQVIYDPRDPDPFLLHPGDRVRFVPVRAATFPEVPLGQTQPVRPLGRPVFEVLEAGLYTTVQDLGRPGYRSQGLPAGGAMDRQALQIANILAGNPSGAAAIECAAPGPVLRALDDVTIALAGADLSPTLDGVPLEMWSAVGVRAGATLAFGAPRRGLWTYIAVSGGIVVPKMLGSASTYVPGGLGGAGGRRTQAGDVFGRGEGAGRRAKVPLRELPVPADDVIVRAIPGPQANWFSEEGQARLWREAYRTTVASDRAGVRLEGPAISHRGAADILSDGMLPGAIQVPAGGQPIVIMPDGPTTGGYPKIAVVASVDLRLVAQARPGTRIRFAETTVEAATDALGEWHTLINELTATPERGNMTTR